MCASAMASLELPPRKLLFGSKRIQGWNPRGLRFTEPTSIRTDDREISLDKVNEAWERMGSGKAECRVVLIT